MRGCSGFGGGGEGEDEGFVEAGGAAVGEGCERVSGGEDEVRAEAAVVGVYAGDVRGRKREGVCENVCTVVLTC